MKRLAVLAVLPALAIAACSSSGDPSGSPSTSASSTTSPQPAAESSPSPLATAWTEDEAGAYYLATICATNDVTDKFNKAFRGNDWKFAKVKARAKELRDSSRSAAAALDEPPFPWPANVQKDIDRMIDEYLGELTYYQALANSKDRNVLIARSYDYVETSRTPTQRIRLRLGLPRAPRGC